MQHGERRLQPRRAHRRLLERDLLLLPRVRRMVRGDAVDRAVAQAGDQRPAVGLGAQRRVHLQARVQPLEDRLVGEREVVRGALGRDRDAGRPDDRDRLDGLARRQMLDVDAAALVAGDGGVAGDHGQLGDTRNAREPEPRGHLPLVHDAGAAERGVLLVQREQPAAQPLVLQRAAQHRRTVHRLAVVREAERPRVAQLGHLGQRVALQAARDRRHEADGDPSLVPCGLAQGAQHRRVVDRGRRVGHRHDGDVAAGRGGARARVEVLLVLLPGHAQVHVGVDEAREDVAAGAVEDLGAVRRVQRAGRAEPGDRAVAHEHVERRVDPLARVEHVRAPDEQVGGRLGPVDQRIGAAPGERRRVRAGCGVGRNARGRSGAGVKRYGLKQEKKYLLRERMIIFM